MLKLIKTPLLIGLCLIFISLSFFVLIFYPVILAEVNYQLKSINTNSGRSLQKQTMAAGQDFQIVIPKIDLRSPVLSNIDPFNKKEYLKSLKKGVAHAKGSALPGKKGNIFIFGHSTDLPMNIASLNAVFYLVNKLKPGDEIYLNFSGKEYRYIVDNTKIVSPGEIDYLQQTSSDPTLTLMTCWPPGTTLKRLLVIARQTE